MNNNDIIKGAISNIIEGRDSPIFIEISKDIDVFFEKYGVIKWLSSSQSAMIYEILMLDHKNEIIKQIEGYKDRQLERASEKDKWKKEKDDEMAIDYFYGMIHGILETHDPQINEELEDRFQLAIDNRYDSMIYQSLIRTFDYIFITKFRILKLKEGKKDV